MTKSVSLKSRKEAAAKVHRPQCPILLSTGTPRRCVFRTSRARRVHAIGWENINRDQSMKTSEFPLGPASLQLAAENNDGEKSAGSIGDLLDQVSNNSVREVHGLIGELRQLSAKLQADGDRIKRDIVDYEALSQQVMQLTKIISDSVATLTPATNGRAPLPSISWRKA